MGVGFAGRCEPFGMGLLDRHGWACGPALRSGRRYRKETPLRPRARGVNAGLVARSAEEQEVCHVSTEPATDPRRLRPGVDPDALRPPPDRGRRLRGLADGLPLGAGMVLAGGAVGEGGG